MLLLKMVGFGASPGGGLGEKAEDMRFEFSREDPKIFCSGV